MRAMHALSLAWAPRPQAAAPAGRAPGPRSLQPPRRRGCGPARPHASPSDSEFEGVPGGDEELQRALEDQLRLQLKSETIKESIREDLRSKVEDLKSISEEVGGARRPGRPRGLEGSPPSSVGGAEGRAVRGQGRERRQPLR
jgi:hypothetical protein